MPSKAAAKPAASKKNVPGKQALKGKKGSAVSKVSKKQQLRFAIDCAHPVEDGIMNVADFETYLKGKIKVRALTRLDEPTRADSSHLPGWR